MTTPYGEGPTLPAIPDPRYATVESVLLALKEWVEVRDGSRAEYIDKAVTFRDLLNTDIVSADALRSALGTGVQQEIPPIPGAGEPAVPPTPTNLIASGAVESILLTWLFTQGYNRLAYFEVWRASTNNLADAVLLAQSYETSFVDSVGAGQTFYYWVRAVSDGGKSGYNAMLGTPGTTALDTADVIGAIHDELNNSGLLDQLTIKVDNDGLISGYGLASTPSLDDGTNSTTFAILADRFVVAAPASEGIIPAPPFFVQTVPTTVNGVSVPKGVYMTDAYIMNGVITTAKIGLLQVDDARISTVNVSKLTAGQLNVSAFIQSSNFSSGVSGFQIHGNGNAEFNNVTVRGTVYATAGNIGSLLISGGNLQTTNFNGSSLGWIIRADGSAHFTNGTFSGNVVGGHFMTGAFTGYAWPPSGGGSYLGPSGLLLGNANTGGYFQVTASGDLYAPGFHIIGGVLTVSQLNVINTPQVVPNAITTMAANGQWNNAGLNTVSFSLAEASLVLLACGCDNLDFAPWIEVSLSATPFPIYMGSGGAAYVLLTPGTYIATFTGHYMPNPQNPPTTTTGKYSIAVLRR